MERSLYHYHTMMLPVGVRVDHVTYREGQVTFRCEDYESLRLLAENLREAAEDIENFVNDYDTDDSTERADEYTETEDET